MNLLEGKNPKYTYYCHLLIYQDLPVYQIIRIRIGSIFRLLSVVCCHAGDITDVTLAFEDAQVIQSFQAIIGYNRLEKSGIG